MQGLRRVLEQVALTLLLMLQLLGTLAAKIPEAASDPDRSRRWF